MFGIFQGFPGKKDLLQITQMNNGKQPLKLIRTKCQKQNFEDFIDVYSKTHFPRSFHALPYLVLFLGLELTAADVGAKMKSEGLWYSGVNCSPLHQRKRTDCSQDKSSVNNFKCAIAHSIDLNDLVTRHHPRQLLPKRDLCHVLSKSSPNSGHRYMFRYIFGSCSSQLERTFGLLCYKKQKGHFLYFFP